tara:strand:+ start:52623 stop:52814 length:192 start_codon:yes stop_codon:yes gene_type:complete
MTMKTRHMCSVCSSEDILADAYAEWNIEKQEWQLQNVFDYSGAFCNACDGPTTLVQENDHAKQ